MVRKIRQKGLQSLFKIQDLYLLIVFSKTILLYLVREQYTSILRIK